MTEEQYPFLETSLSPDAIRRAAIASTEKDKLKALNATRKDLFNELLQARKNGETRLVIEEDSFLSMPLGWDSSWEALYAILPELVAEGYVVIQTGGPRPETSWTNRLLNSWSIIPKRKVTIEWVG